MPLFQFIGVAIGASVFVSFASLAWPKVTSQPRPEVLTKVRDVVVQTEVGKGLEQVLGVSLGETVASGAAAVVDTVTRSAKQSVIMRMFESLSEEEQEAFRAQICTP